MMSRRVLIYLSVILFFFTSCEKAFNLDNPDRTATAVFDELWNVMDQHYALFQVKDIDWQQVYATYRPQISNDMSSKQLFDKMDQMLQTLKDGHVTLMSPEDTVTYEGFYKNFPANFNYNNILVNYLKNDYKTSGPLVYKVVDNTAYIYYNSFSNDITDAELDAVLNDIQFSKGLIIDVRNNTGGGSANVDRLVKHFVGANALMKYEVTKKGPAHDDLNAPIPYYIQPAGAYYNLPVVVLTNRRCFSACNDFVLYMSQLPKVRVIGDQTGGGGSLPNEYILANGWKIRYSATITLSPDKKSVEAGIAPDVQIGINIIDEANGKDPIIEKAFQSLQ
jgi:C-terminal processing protease CtpA/Prc